MTDTSPFRLMPNPSGLNSWLAASTYDTTDTSAALLLQLLSAMPSACAKTESPIMPTPGADKPATAFETSSMESTQAGRNMVRRSWQAVVEHAVDTSFQSAIQTASLPSTVTAAWPQIKATINKSDQRMARNRQSAARSRLRHKMVLDELRARATRLEDDNVRLVTTLRVKTAQLDQALQLLQSLSMFLLD